MPVCVLDDACYYSHRQMRFLDEYIGINSNFYGFTSLLLVKLNILSERIINIFWEIKNEIKFPRLIQINSCLNEHHMFFYECLISKYMEEFLIF